MSFRFGTCGGDGGDSGGDDAVVVVAGRFQRKEKGKHPQMKEEQKKQEEEEEEEEKDDDGDGGGCNRGQRRETAGRALWGTSQRSSGDVQKKVAWLESWQRGNKDDERGRGHAHSFRAFFTVTFFSFFRGGRVWWLSLSVFCPEEKESASVEEEEGGKKKRCEESKKEREEGRKKEENEPFRVGFAGGTQLRRWLCACGKEEDFLEG